MSTQQASLGAFITETVEDSVEELDGLQALAADVAPGFSTTQAREDRSHDRVVSDPSCSVCGLFHDEEDVCPQREANGELADDRLRTIGGSGSGGGR